MHEIIVALLCDHTLLGCAELSALAQTCRAARRLTAPLLHALKPWVTACDHVLHIMARILPLMMRTMPRMVATYDSCFWEPLLAHRAALTPVELAVCYAVVMQRFPTRGRVENMESSWICRARTDTMLIKHVPEEEGSVHFSGFVRGNMSVIVRVHLLTRKVRITLQRDLEPGVLHVMDAARADTMAEALEPLLKRSNLLEATGTEVADMLLPLLQRVPVCALPKDTP